jgi:hypothetical protein
MQSLFLCKEEILIPNINTVYRTNHDESHQILVAIASGAWQSQGMRSPRRFAPRDDDKE